MPKNNGVTISLLWLVTTISWNPFSIQSNLREHIPSSSQWIIIAVMPHLQKDGIDGGTEILVVSEIIVDFLAVNLHLRPYLS